MAITNGPRVLSRPMASEFAVLGGPLLLAALCWPLLGQSWPLLLAPLPFVLRTLYHLIRLTYKIRRQHRFAPPFTFGLWGEVYRAVARHQQRGRKGRKRQIRFSRRFREAANAVPDALIILDNQHCIDWANPAAARLMNIRWPEHSGQPFSTLMAQQGLENFITAGDYLRPRQLIPEHDRTITLSMRITPFGERKKQRLVVGRDITRVQYLNTVRRDFVANASHELRTPLTVLAGFLETLLDAPTTPATQRRALTLMQNQTGRMCSIIEDLLTLSRLEMDETRDLDKVADVPEMLDSILTEARALSAGRHRLMTDIREDLLLMGSPAELSSAFSNLVFNAVKHTSQDTSITVSWNLTAAGEPIFTVTDDGPGIPPEHLPRLTERFYRVDSARSRQSGGTGLGLAIVKHVLNRHDARLDIVSEVGRGTTFSSRFPADCCVLREQDIAEQIAMNG